MQKVFTKPQTKQEKNMFKFNKVLQLRFYNILQQRYGRTLLHQRRSKAAVYRRFTK